MIHVSVNSFPSSQPHGQGMFQDAIPHGWYKLSRESVISR
ncbi:hypothetical protein FOCG_14351 [Fusarium oxysporum f. sp. radicis-lycopersici 26381]|uniref:Uncharacterized protein n=3 Tax=Fusarium oxysporum TaxID=5507 RepID=A0A0J9UCD9_FUSO4|nr:hypothetical protein FOXG_18022 [Fusarium oxysporum f. sp. lycopersici 4287]EWZ52156.1 hypothetical protein FOZG_01963 [Fusarium oxysporum Fo47]EWZ86807.1 hypothetical protein FOWG_10331 [Fusarium oxysporum f. sp. lycopersici MN25]EXK49450.1 hypothetical protein FOMG_01977 [Fusarium oxysporum f. sp. melonis 26406]EXL44195.1 hypothetical protein FOCG_14351 [Fusarium oxysporum f. sp. radicis-lycopersici 26381]KAI8417902.1 hypothetical protein FOFC_00462 [Fusarium oxysporum]